MSQATQDTSSPGVVGQKKESRAGSKKLRLPDGDAEGLVDGEPLGGVKRADYDIHYLEMVTVDFSPAYPNVPGRIFRFELAGIRPVLYVTVHLEDSEVDVILPLSRVYGVKVKHLGTQEVFPAVPCSAGYKLASAAGPTDPVVVWPRALGGSTPKVMGSSWGSSAFSDRKGYGSYDSVPSVIEGEEERNVEDVHDSK